MELTVITFLKKKVLLDEAVWRIAHCAALRQQQQPRTSVAAPLFYKVGHKGRKLSIKSSLYSIDDCLERGKNNFVNEYILGMNRIQRN